MERKYLGVFEGIPIEGLLNYPIEDKVPSKDISKKDIQRILTIGMKKFKMDYGGRIDSYMIKDYKTGTKLVLSLRENEDNPSKITGFVEKIYPISYFPYSDPDEDQFFSKGDSLKTINKKLKQKSTEGYFLYYSYKETTFCSDFFEDGVLYHTYKIININKKEG